MHTNIGYHTHVVVHSKKEANSEKEANWLLIRRERQIGCQFEERVNEPPVNIHPKQERKGE